MTPLPDQRAVLAATVFVVLAVAAGLAWESSPRQVSDLTLYRTYGERIAQGKVPYRDFDVEYPPGALVVVVVPALLTESLAGFRETFVVLLALTGAIGIVLVDLALGVLGRRRRERNLTSVALALSPLVLGAILVSRFDLLPATLSVAAVYALLLGRMRLGGALLGVAVAVKLYPGVLLPLAATWAAVRGGKRAAGELVGLTLGVALLAYLPFALVAPGGVVHSLAHQASRPLQIESLGASLLLAAHHVAGFDLSWSSGHGSQNLDGSAAGVFATLSSLAVAATLLAIWWWHARGPLSDEALVRAAAAAVLAFVALGKVLSPQFVIWLLFLVPLVGGRTGRVASALTALACVLTALWFPLRYWDLVRGFDPLASWLLLGRNLSLVAALVAVVVPLSRAARERAPRRSRSPDPSAGRT
jgi:hypothetical protein